MKINGYILQEPPFKGGMALVYKGVNANGFERAFKFVRPDKAENSPRLCQQFIKEIQLQSKLNHPNIIRILDAFSHTDDTGKAFTVLEMEWLNGLDLERYVKQKAKKGMGDDAVKKVLLQTLDGLEYAHKHNVLHLDIKPSNLFRTFDGYVKIIDFGIARVVGDNAQIIDGAEKLTLVTETGGSTFKGTMAYASPEQQVGGKLGFYSDIYSLGKTLHFLCTGTTDPSVEIASPLFASIVEKCTIDNPKKRFQSCAELRDALTVFHRPVQKHCIHCGKLISNNIEFCSFCGGFQKEKKVEKPMTKMWKCKKCGKVIREEFADNLTRFCSNCGSQDIVCIS